MTSLIFVRCFGDCANRKICGENMSYATESKVLVEKVGNKKYMRCANYTGKRIINMTLDSFTN